jgi:hypothetical protein
MGRPAPITLTVNDLARNGAGAGLCAGRGEDTGAGAPAAAHATVENNKIAAGIRIARPLKTSQAFILPPGSGRICVFPENTSTSADSISADVI